MCYGSVQHRTLCTSSFMKKLQKFLEENNEDYESLEKI